MPPQRLVFTHIGKTGGSAMSAVLQHIAEHAGLNRLLVSGASSTNGDPNLPAELLRRHGLDIGDFQIVSGHVPFATAWRCFGPARFITVLRDPVWRSISNYTSQPNNMGLPDFGMSHLIRLFRDHPHAEWAIDNLQTRMLADDPKFFRPVTRDMLAQAKRNLREHYAIVGFQNEWDRFAAATVGQYGLKPLPPIRANETGDYRKHVRWLHRLFVRNREWLDIRLYKWARRQFANAPALAPIGRPRAGVRFRNTVIGVEGCETYKFRSKPIPI